MSRESRIHESGGCVREQPESTERRLALDTSSEIIRQRDDFIGAAQNELTGMQYECLIRTYFYCSREIRLFLTRIDERLAMVLECAEEPIKSNIDGRRLDHGWLERLEPDAAEFDFGADVAV